MAFTHTDTLTPDRMIWRVFLKACAFQTVLSHSQNSPEKRVAHHNPNF
ncbi:hypothetical protein RKLH11_1219 [Rhodobacteraceae bacterium KLH11]|nr:hypothetical protein RKLH11_1219 [Rhodobacteraceae bacterium KLH11]